MLASEKLPSSGWRQAWTMWTPPLTGSTASSITQNSSIRGTSAVRDARVTRKVAARSGVCSPPKVQTARMLPKPEPFSSRL